MKLLLILKIFGMVTCDLASFNRLRNNIDTYLTNQESAIRTAVPYKVMGKGASRRHLVQLLDGANWRMSKRQRVRRNFYLSRMMQIHG